MRQLVARHSFPSVPDDVVQKFKERNQVKNEVALNVQEISSGLPLLSMTRKSLSLMKI
jgi:hypothetical protein